MMKKYLVGGAVRDTILGVEPHDFDYVVIGASDDEKAAMTKDMFRISKNYEVYQDAHGYEYTFADGSIETDLARRDFTCNAIAYDAESNQYIDPFGGIEDIRQGCLRMVAQENIVEDPVRAVRGYRMLSVLARCDEERNVMIDENTRAVIQKWAVKAFEASPDRCWQELTKGFKEPSWMSMFQAWSQDGLPWAFISSSWEINNVYMPDVRAALALSRVNDNVWRDEWLGYGGHKMWKTLSGVVRDMHDLSSEPNIRESLAFWQKWQKHRDHIEQLRTVFDKHPNFYQIYDRVFGDNGLYAQGTQYALSLGVKGSEIKSTIERYVLASLTQSEFLSLS